MVVAVGNITLATPYGSELMFDVLPTQVAAIVGR
jgi:hypothetical protein